MAHGAKREEKKPEGIDFGMRPPASPSCRLYEPEAIGAFAYTPAGMRKEKSILDELFPEGPSKLLKLNNADL